VGSSELDEVRSQGRGRVIEEWGFGRVCPAEEWEGGQKSMMTFGFHLLDIEARVGDWFSNKSMLVAVSDSPSKVASHCTIRPNQPGVPAFPIRPCFIPSRRVSQRRKEAISKTSSRK
jgi:hypothetical protein